jgi:hypothetical protein
LTQIKAGSSKAEELHHEGAAAKLREKIFPFKFEAATLKQQLQNIMDTVHAGRHGLISK